MVCYSSFENKHGTKLLASSGIVRLQGLVIDPSHYADIIEERSIENLCGYPVCGNVLKKVIMQLPTCQNKDIKSKSCTPIHVDTAAISVTKSFVRHQMSKLEYTTVIHFIFRFLLSNFKYAQNKTGFTTYLKERYAQCYLHMCVITVY